MVGAITDSRLRAKAGETGGMRSDVPAPKPRPIRKLLCSLALVGTIFGACGGNGPAANCEPSNGTQTNKCNGVRTEQVVEWKDSSDLEKKSTCYNAGGILALTNPSGCAELTKVISVEGLEQDNSFTGLNVPGCNLYATLPGPARIVYMVTQDKLVTIQMKPDAEKVEVTASCNEPNAGCDMRFTMGPSQIAEIYFGDRISVSSAHPLVMMVGPSPEIGVSLNYLTYTKDGKVPFFNINLVCLSKWGEYISD